MERGTGKGKKGKGRRGKGEKKMGKQAEQMQYKYLPHVLATAARAALTTMLFHPNRLYPQDVSLNKSFSGCFYQVLVIAMSRITNTVFIIIIPSCP